MPGVADRRAQRPSTQQVARKLREGVCTHEDVRQVLWLALQREDVCVALRERLARTIRGLIVDEVFDGNELDLAVVEFAAVSGVEVTIIGDPWQALYRFRGARPDLVPALVESSSMTTLPLLQSFRWRSEQQADLARRLRAGESTVLPRGDAADSLDVVLASEWAHLWELNASVLPLAFGSAKGNIPEAGATMLLDYATRQLLGLAATYADDALATLRIADPTAIDRLDRGWPEVIDHLRRPGRPGLNQAYNALVALVATETDVTFPAVRGNYTRRLGWLRDRVVLPANLIPGLTVHQAKGREWGVSALRLKGCTTRNC